MSGDTPWLVGRELGRTVYCGEKFIALFDDPEMAKLVVSKMNAEWNGDASEPGEASARAAAESWLLDASNDESYIDASSERTKAGLTRLLGQLAEKFPGLATNTPGGSYAEASPNARPARFHVGDRVLVRETSWKDCEGKLATVVEIVEGGQVVGVKVDDVSGVLSLAEVSLDPAPAADTPSATTCDESTADLSHGVRYHCAEPRFPRHTTHTAAKDDGTLYVWRVSPRATPTPSPAHRDLKPAKVGTLADLLTPMAREFLRSDACEEAAWVAAGCEEIHDVTTAMVHEPALAVLLAKVHGMGRRCGEEFPTERAADNFVSSDALCSAALEYAAGLRPPVACSEGRAARVERILRAHRPAGWHCFLCWMTGTSEGPCIVERDMPTNETVLADCNECGQTFTVPGDYAFHKCPGAPKG